MHDSVINFLLLILVFLFICCVGSGLGKLLEEYRDPKVINRLNETLQRLKKNVFQGPLQGTVIWKHV